MARRFLWSTILCGAILLPLQACFVTYNFSNGRFGDRLLSYMHAKWLSYKYGLTLLYKPFIYSDKLMMDSLEQHLSNNQHFSRIIEVSSEDIFRHGIDQHALYVASYFPESPFELKREKFSRFNVGWQDEGFMKVLNEMVRSKVALPEKVLPSGITTVALHMRRGGSIEPFSSISTVESLAAKFPQNVFYEESLDRLYKVLGEQPLYVFIFTDDQRPDLIVERFCEIFKGKNIVFDCRREKNDHNINVLEDFFALTQFDCLIRPDSNFSLCASKLKKYAIEVTLDEDLKGGMLTSTVAGISSANFVLKN